MRATAPLRSSVTLGAKRDGTLTGIQVDITTALWHRRVGSNTGIYHDLYSLPERPILRDVRVREHADGVLPRAGYVEGAFGLECAMDVLAQLRLDPAALRQP